MSHTHTHDHPATYRAAQVQEVGGKFKLVDIQWKDPAADEVVVKVIACGVCHSDAAVIYDSFGAGFPRIPGHEIVGKVFSVGANETRFKVGELVGAGWTGDYCGVCSSCKKGDFVTCKNGSVNGVLTDGGYGEFVTLKSRALVSMPQDIDPYEAAPLLCAGVTVYNSVRNMNVRGGDVVAVQGIGGLGHLALQYCHALGFRTVAISSGSSKATLAKELGADYYIDSSASDAAEELNKLGGAKVVLATAPNAQVISKLVHGMAVGGQLVVLAISEDLQIPILPIISRRVSIIGWPAGGPVDNEETASFSHDKGIKARIQKFKLEEANEAFGDMMSGKARFRSVLAIA